MNSNALEMLSGMLSNPSAMENISNMVKGMNAKDKEENQERTEIKEEPIKFENNNSIPDMSFLANIFANNENSIQAMNKMRKAYDTFNNVHDPSINLINALSPYLSVRRMNNANKLITMVKVSKAINVFREE